MKNFIVVLSFSILLTMTSCSQESTAENNCRRHAESKMYLFNPDFETVKFELKEYEKEQSNGAHYHAVYVVKDKNSSYFHTYDYDLDSDLEVIE